MKKAFQTEVGQMLHLVIHSLYSKKEVFLRELLSNASDACDRSRFEGLTDKTQACEEGYKITILPNREAKTLTIADNGIGMTAEEAERNLGTVASSGTKRFLEAMKDKADAPELIGQFGVGFYAAFMVADKVDVVSRRRGAKAVRWSSDGEGEYECEETDEDLAYGTSITLHLREDGEEFLYEWTLENIVRTYSDYISYPILLCPDPSEKPEPRKDEDGKELPPEKKEPRQVNSMKALWKRAKKDVTKEETDAFYKHIAHDGEAPLSTIQFAAEGSTEFHALLFIPRTVPQDLFFANAKLGLQLYVRNVFIGDDIKELLPRYLSFVRGVVESSDLPLNVSREMLQDNAVIRKMRKVLVGKILGDLEDMQKNRVDDFLAFSKQYGRFLKEGARSDWENKDKVLELCLFPSTFAKDGKHTSLKDYVSRMPSDQKDIYYLSADTEEAARNSPLLESFEKHGYEVLFFTDPVDEFFAESTQKYADKSLRAADRGELDLDDPEGKKNRDKDGKKIETDEDRRFKPLSDFLRERFKDGVSEVRLTARLTDSACCFVADEYGPSAHMERVLRAFNQPVPKTKRILELNPVSPLVVKMLGLVGSDESALGDLADLLYGQAQLAEGTPLDNPTRFNKLVCAFAAK